MKKLISIIYFITTLCAATFLFNNSKTFAADSSNTITIPVAFATDDNYCYPTFIAMDSLINNKRETTFINFHIMISGKLSKENKERFRNFENIYKGCSVELIDMKDKFSDAYLCNHDYVTTPSFYRLALPSLLPQYDKILYLDGDILVKKDLQEMFNIDIENYYIGGVKDYGWIVHINDTASYAKRLGINAMDEYINSGILLINSKKIRDDNLEKAFSDYALTLKDRRLCLPDQDLLNAVCYKKIKLISPEYNAMQHFYFSYDTIPILIDCYDWQEWKTACANPTIVHFAGASKPWTTYKYRFYNEWEKYRQNVDKNLYGKVIPEGTYRILSALEENKAVDISEASNKNKANVQLWNENYTNAQMFKFNHITENYYQIEAVCSGKVLDVEEGKQHAGANVLQYDKNCGDNQIWKIIPTNDGCFNIVSKCNGLYLDVAGGLTKPGTNVQVWTPNGTLAQKFKIVR